MNLDAYTVRKAVPRILIAAIGINLSIYLAVAAIDISIIVGKGIDDLLVGSFSDKGTLGGVAPGGESSGDTVGGFAILGILLGTTAIWATAGVGIFAGLLPLIAVIAFTALAILFTVIIVQALIIFLTIVSPVAIALFVLPGTEKYFQMWWDTFTKALMVFPIVAVILAMSKVLTVILLGTSNLDTGTLGTIGAAKAFAAIAVIYAPLILIPFAFKLAGGAISALSNAASGFSNGRATAKRMQDDPDSLYNRLKTTGMENRSKRGTSGRQLYARTRHAFDPDKRAGAVGAARQAEGIVASKRRMQQSDWEFGKDDNKFTEDLAFYGSPSESRAAIADGTHHSLRNSRSDAEKMIREKYGVDGKPLTGPLTAQQAGEVENLVNQDKQQMYAVSAAADRTGRNQAIRDQAASSSSFIAYGLDPGNQGGYEQFKRVRDSIFGEDDSAQKRAWTNKFQYIAKGSGRFDMSLGTDGDPIFDESGNITDKAKDRGWKAASLYQLATMVKPADTRHHVARTVELLQSDSKEDRKAGAIRVQELRQMQPNAIGGIRDAIQEKMEDMETLEREYLESEVDSSSFTDPSTGAVDTKARERAILSERSKVSKEARVYERPDPNDPNFRKSYEDYQNRDN